MFLQKVIKIKCWEKKLGFVGVLKVIDEKSSVRIQSWIWFRIRNQVYKSKDPDPYLNVTDPEHWLNATGYNFSNPNEIFTFLHKIGTVEVPNSQRISCLDSSLGKASACGAGGRRFAPRPWHVCLGTLLEDRDDPGQVSL